MTRLVLINGAPGSGKSTVAHRLAQDHPLDFALDVDVVKHALGQWRADMTTAGRHARRLALALIDAQLESGHDVYMGQFLARTEFIDELQGAAQSRGATFVEIILIADEPTLWRRLAGRDVAPDRAEHVGNSGLLAPDHIPGLVQAIQTLATNRMSATTIDATDDLDRTVNAVRRIVAASR